MNDFMPRGGRGEVNLHDKGKGVGGRGGGLTDTFYIIVGCRFHTNIYIQGVQL